MHQVLSQNIYLVKEHVGMFKAANNYDIYNPASNSVIMECREQRMGTFSKMLRFTELKRMTPFDIRVRASDGQQIVRVKRGVSFFLSEVVVLDENDQHIGGFKQKFFSIGGGFNILDTNGKSLCQLQGKWTGWDFKFMADQTELAHITKKWTGIGREMFTSADNYVLCISEGVPKDSMVRQLILAAVMCIDMVLKE